MYPTAIFINRNAKINAFKKIKKTVLKNTGLPDSFRAWQKGGRMSKYIIQAVLFVTAPIKKFNQKMYEAEDASFIPALLSAVWTIMVIIFNFIGAEPLHEQFSVFFTLLISGCLIGAGIVAATWGYLLIVQFLQFITSPFAAIYDFCESKARDEVIDLSYFIEKEKDRPVNSVRFYPFVLWR